MTAVGKKNNDDGKYLFSYLDNVSRERERERESINLQTSFSLNKTMNLDNNNIIDENDKINVNN